MDGAALCQRVPLRSARALRGAVLILVALLVGCESPSGLKFPTWDGTDRGDSLAKQEDQHRTDFQTHRSHDALRWLLSHRVAQGMTRHEVESILGQAGERERNDRWLKTRGQSLRIDDEIYRFGPDDRGYTVYLAFREGNLVNYDPDQFLKSSGPADKPEKADSR